MGFLSKVLEKLGINKPAKAETITPKAAPSAPPVAPAAPAAIAVIDVVAQLEKLAAANREKLNWKVLIVDLLKLLGIESSFAARKEFAAVLGYPSKRKGVSAQMNMWLHKTALQ